MLKQKLHSWRLVSKQISSVFLFVIIFLTPSLVFADVQNHSTNSAGLYFNANIGDLLVITSNAIRSSACSSNNTIVTLTMSAPNLSTSTLAEAGMHPSGVSSCQVSLNYRYVLTDSGAVGINISSYDQSFISVDVFSPTTTPSVINNPNQDIFNGFICFFALSLFVIYLFKRV
jgi:hypothetical protein